jgi:hypothetical protein
MPKSVSLGYAVERQEFLHAAVAICCHDKHRPGQRGLRAWEAKNDVVMELALRPVVDVFDSA